MTAPLSRFLPLLLLALCLPLAARAGFKPGPGWPEVSMPFYHASNQTQARARLMIWRQQAGHSIRGYRDTGSMQPVLRGGRELLAMQACRPDTPLARGQMVVFNRGDLPAVLHYIAAVSCDGRHPSTPEPRPLSIALQATVAVPAIEATPPPDPRP